MLLSSFAFFITGLCAMPVARAALIRIESQLPNQNELFAQELLSKDAVADSAVPAASNNNNNNEQQQIEPNLDSEFDITNMIFGGLSSHNLAHLQQHRHHHYHHHHQRPPCATCAGESKNITINWEAPVNREYENDDDEEEAANRETNLLKILHRHGAGVFGHLLQETGAVKDLAGGGPYTVFAPLDHAFERVPQSVKDYFKKHPDRLRMLLLFHVLKNQKLSLDELEDKKEDTFTTMFHEQKMRIKYYQSHDSLIAGSGLVVKSKSDIAFDNGLVHGLHDVILRIPFNTSGAIIQKCPNFATFQKAILAAGLESALVQPGPLTVFAPSEAAWAQLPPGVEQKIFNNRTALKLVVMYHLVHGTWFKEGLETGQRLDTFSGRPLFVHRSADTGILRINKIGVEAADVGATNGIMHVLKGVLIPQEILGILPPDYVGSDGGEAFEN